MTTIDRLQDAIATAEPGALPTLYRDITNLWGRGGIADEPAAQLLAAIDARRVRRFAPAAGGLPQRSPQRSARVFSTGRQRPRSPDRVASQARRRRMAMAGYLPGEMAAEGELTMGASAVLAVIAEALITTGRCALPIAAIAAKAGVCHRLAQSAMRQAERMGWLMVEERRRAGRPSLTNVVRIACRRWADWIKRRIARRQAAAGSTGEGAENCARPLSRYKPASETAATMAQRLSNKSGNAAHRAAPWPHRPRQPYATSRVTTP